MRAMKILVTGGAGFIGSHVVDRFLALGHRVSVIDDLSTGFRRNLNPKARFYEADIRNSTRVREIFHKERPEVVCHHAALAEVVKSVRDPLPTLEVNVQGTVNLLLAGGEHSLRRFIFSSTGGAIYGEPGPAPASERTPAAPLSPYGLSKLLGEECIRFYARYFGFRYVLLRYPNIYGPRQNPKGEAGVIAIFGGLMRGGDRPAIFGDGSKSRDYLYVADVVRANVLALRRGKDEALNLGWGRKVSDQAIFDALARNMGYEKPCRYAPFRQGEVYQISLDSRRARQRLGWRPRVELEAGIRAYLRATYPALRKS